MTAMEQVMDASSSLASGDDGEAVCYLCLDDGGVDDEADQSIAT